MKLMIQAVARHRNGVGGAPFHVVLFNDGDEGPMLAIVFDEKFHCAVLHRDKLAADDIAFASNSWRGDRYSPTSARPSRRLNRTKFYLTEA